MLAFVVALLISNTPDTQISTSRTFFPRSLTEQYITCDTRHLTKPIATLDSFTVRWYRSMLAAAKEPSLYASNTNLVQQGFSALRFTWLRSFNHPITIRLYWSKKGRSRLIAKELSGMGGYEPGKLKRLLRRYLSADEATTFAKMIRSQHASTMTPRVCDLGTDGAQWIIEASNSKGYTFIDRQSPESGPVRRIGLALIRLTGWQVGEVY